MEENMENTENTDQESVNQGEGKQDRPEINYQAELARKNAELARLRSEMEQSKAPAKRDPADITTWTDNELKMLRNSADPSVAQWKDQADEVLLERKVKAIQAREYEARRKEDAKTELAKAYPESLDPTSEFSAKVDQVMREYDLHRSPSGRLAAAKIVAAEKNNTSDKGQHIEKDRVNRVKNQMVDGDRPKPTDTIAPDKKREEVKEGLMDTRNNDRQVQAVKDYFDSRGITKDKFFNR